MASIVKLVITVSSMSEIVEVDLLVIGAGAVGMAIGSMCSGKFDTVVVDKKQKIGMYTSSRNSGVIHSGIYYRNGSQKHQHCVRGRELLYDYCKTYGVDFNRIGKLIVATSSDQLEKLEELYINGIGNGVPSLEKISSERIYRFEPNINAVEAIYSPETGIIDVHDYLYSLNAVITENHGHVSVNSEVCSIDFDGDLFTTIILQNDKDEIKIKSKYLVNSAGHCAPYIAQQFSYYKNMVSPKYGKGRYMKLSGNCPFSHLIYPIPEPNGLGIHATINLDGSVKFGPDFDWVSYYDTSVLDVSVDKFCQDISKYWPGVTKKVLTPDFAGVRPRVMYRGELLTDFKIDDFEIHSIPGLVNLFGIESPGLTASLSLAQEVSSLLLAKT